MGLNDLLSSDWNSLTSADLALTLSLFRAPSVSAMTCYSFDSEVGLGCGRQRLQERRILEGLGDQILRLVLAVHEREKVLELLAGLEQLVQRVHLAGDGVGREVFELIEA